MGLAAKSVKYCSSSTFHFRKNLRKNSLHICIREVLNAKTKYIEKRNTNINNKLIFSEDVNWTRSDPCSGVTKSSERSYFFSKGRAAEFPPRNFPTTSESEVCYLFLLGSLTAEQQQEEQHGFEGYSAGLKLKATGVTPSAARLKKCQKKEKENLKQRLRQRRTFSWALCTQI